MPKAAHEAVTSPMDPAGPRFTPTRLGAIALASLALTLGACGGDDPVAATPASTTPTVVAGCELNGTTGGEAVVLPGDPNAPEIATGYAPKNTVYAKTYMAVTNNPVSTKAACDVLKNGGTAVDAAVAAQMVLNLVEPQSSGIGGGSFIMYYDAATKQVTAYDGREMAPAAADGNYIQWKSAADQTTPAPNATHSGRSIGTPGTLRVLELAHGEHGKLAWKDLFSPAIKLATDGFPIPPRMAAAIASAVSNPVTAPSIKRDAEMAGYFLNADGTPRAVNTIIKNPALANVFSSVASGGADAFYKNGPIAQAIVAKIQNTYGGTATPGLTTLADLENYVAKKRTAVCTTYREYEICGMPPPSSGGIAVAQIMGIIENYEMSRYAPSNMDKNGGRPNVLGVHLMAEAGNLAYADRNKYVADTDFIGLPGGTWESMLNKPYLRKRADLISTVGSMTLPVAAGDLGAVPLAPSVINEHGTTHLSLTDKYGNVVSMTTTIEAGLGSYHFTNGFLLNNQLTDFNAAPADAGGVPIANRVQPGKRPRSSMAPTLVFKRNADGSRGDFYMTTGSPGGASIIQYVAKTLVGVLDWKMDAQQAVSMIDFGGSNSAASGMMVGGEHPNVDATKPAGGLAGDNDPLVKGLRGLGHVVNVTAQSSGLSAIIRTTVGGSTALVGGADPRREGVVLGDTFKP
ncbi:gamma-glutamyltransferase family protein [Cupriavidus sp. UME77]|uniref:gamma-glutamyltransferase family protein n=1 Tax=Cupriavidus sp. UME77 TaxID=1862321 RepID=UPI001601B718|nr:gamma-glutamyltransferase [Cupriavidus sp. UME77]